ncbi:AAA family ATPase [Candidatus Saccharibacteria bacterium]|nr:MAG: AAA family ATPase [Candidatus Saccharibacteria bacterium]
MISNVRLQHFRSYEDGAFEFSDGVNIIVGPNGSGKTNLLEALLVLARGGSYRAGDADLLEFGSGWVRIDGIIDGAQERTIVFKKDTLLQKTTPWAQKHTVDCSKN